ncbi:MAG: carbohydrate ABC transporter permease [Chloroflexia bacterium]
MRLRRHLRISDLLALMSALLFLLPLYWALVASLRRPDLPPASTLEWWPKSLHWDNYAALFRLLPMGRYLGNSLLVVAVAVPLTWLNACLAGFGLAQLTERLRRSLVLASIGVMMMPSMALWVFRFRLLAWLGWVDTPGALICPALAAGSPLFVLLFYGAFRRIPSEVYDAARMDGASPWTIWWKIALPLVRPASAGVVVLAFLMYWGDFSSPVVYIRRPEWYTMPVALQLLHQLGPITWPLLMAGAMVMILPILLLFFFWQRFLSADFSPSWLLN